jgi:glycosyltransferase involved in cell wall biosynthesis
MRATLLLETIPTYLQREVERLILVDDASCDNTMSVAACLCSQFPGKIDYLRNDVNRKQTFSKNRGKAMAETEYVYFGDDDCVLVPGSIAALLQTMTESKADIVGAVALNCIDGVTPEDRYSEYLREGAIDNPDRFADLKRLRFGFRHRPTVPIALPVTHASFLIRREWYKRIDFDIQYDGNCFREETDFLLQAYRAGARILLDGRAVQINLPPSLATGGVRSTGRLKREWHSLVNTARFLRKHHSYYEEELGVSIHTPMLWYTWNRISAGLKKAVR